MEIRKVYLRAMEPEDLDFLYEIENNEKKLKSSQDEVENFKKEWDELEDEYQIIENIVKARIEAHMTQTQLSEVTGITQSDISKIENGNGNPSLKTLRKIAHAFGKKLKIEFV